MPPRLTINVRQAAFAVVGTSTACASASAIILATGGAALLVGGGIYLATRNHKVVASRLPLDVTNGLNFPEPDTY
ncbi:MAG: hypothetical protein KDB03_17650 [Planctomycetales bacterium]|nr:hypothetical protein [Planctomycetales bacterium]